MSNPLGTLIEDEVARTETALASTRARGQGVLSISGLLIAALGGVLAFTGKNDSSFQVPTSAHWALLLALGAFVVASVMVLIVFLPKGVEWPDADVLANAAEKHWEAKGWDRQVASVMTHYLKTLRSANTLAADQLSVAIVAQVIGVGGIAYAAFRLIGLPHADQGSPPGQPASGAFATMGAAAQLGALGNLMTAGGLLLALWGLSGRIKAHPQADPTGLGRLKGRIQRIVGRKKAQTVALKGASESSSSGAGDIWSYTPPHRPDATLEERVAGLIQAHKTMSELIRDTKAELRSQMRQGDQESRHEAREATKELAKRFADQGAFETNTLRFQLPRELWGMLLALTGAVISLASTFV